MTYTVKEIYYTLQGEGGNVGRASIFLRFTGCNLWSGREQDRAEAICRFCDTDFIGTDGPRGGKYPTSESLADAVLTQWPEETSGTRLVVCTGGEPLLQLDSPLIQALKQRGFEVAVETNGSVEAPDGIDWLCVSPKAGVPLMQLSGNELKLVYPQSGAMPEQFQHLSFERFLLQPMDGPNVTRNTQGAVEYCLTHPKWRFSLQTHKLLGLR
jgi:7-carboxy-7-deazaguanine synthase